MLPIAQYVRRLSLSLSLSLSLRVCVLCVCVCVFVCVAHGDKCIVCSVHSVHCRVRDAHYAGFFSHQLVPNAQSWLSILIAHG